MAYNYNSLGELIAQLMHVEVHKKLADINESNWNQLVPDNHPFLSHQFLSGLEQTNCVCSASGWEPMHIAIYSSDDKSQLLGAMPCYLKYNSYGEYIFDWAWANAYHQAGLDYYPKLLNAVPFTPVTGNRWLIDNTANKNKVESLLFDTLLGLAIENKASSIHSLFLYEDHCQQLTEHDFIKRLSNQFHWNNNKYLNFKDFLSELSSKKRKNINRERRRISESGVHYQWKNGANISDTDWQTMYRFYQHTIYQYGAQAYLNKNFFEHIAKTLAANTHILLAYYENTPIAGGLFFSSDNALYGRYWGALDNYHSLHFETCYYQPIEYCINMGYQLFEAGAQGKHKLARGLLPVNTYSAHWISDKRFAEAIEGFTSEEQQHIEQYNENLIAHSPFKQYK